VADEGISRDEAHSGPRLAVAQSLDVGDYQVFAVSRRNPGLLATIDAEVGSLVRSRGYRRAFARWFFGPDVPPGTVTP
jgi:hypothetical protein